MEKRVEERLEDKDFFDTVESINKQYAGRKYKHEDTGVVFEVFGATLINEKGQGWWGVLLHKIDETGLTVRSIPFAYKVTEFTNGQFTKI